MDSLSGQIGGTIVTTLFPVSVVSVDGDQVVLSQGGDTVQVGQRWQAVRLGEELKDPQTGRSLGRSEHPCCTIRIDRVAAQTSYGTLEEGVDAMRGGFRPGQIELRQKLGSKPKAAAGATASAAPAAAARPASKPKPKPAAAPAEDPNW
jgi:pyruvate/2-oxoglutarate dehydrogenase complex dihydrolipoamide acyltransferase (E2) component